MTVDRECRSVNRRTVMCGGGALLGTLVAALIGRNELARAAEDYARLVNQWFENDFQQMEVFSDVAAIPGEIIESDEDVNDYSFRTFLLLNPNANTSTIEIKLTHLFNAMKNGQTPTTFQLQNLGDLHLTGIDGDNSALQMERIMALVAILILIIASINYVNLSTARALTRIKEISIKKIIGAKRRQLFLQFITETVLTFMFGIRVRY